MTAYKNRGDVTASMIIWPQFIGGILKVDGNYYYGNLDNPISGELLEALEVLMDKKTLSLDVKGEALVDCSHRRYYSR